MRISVQSFTSTAAILTSLGCSAAPRGGAEPATFRQSLGTAALTDVKTEVPKILSRYQYEIGRQDESQALLTILTRWNDRLPLDDERTRGVVEARTRLTLTARARARSGGTADVRIVDLSVENLVLLSDSDDWRPLITPMFQEYLNRLADELKTELLAGIRVY